MQAQMKSPALIPPEAQGTFLPAVEKPRGLVMKLVYAMTRRQFGKVLTPLKVFCARLPVAFGQFYGKISALDKKLRLPPETVMLIREQVAQTNVCLFCIDIGRYFTIKTPMNQAKFDALGQYRTSSLLAMQNARHWTMWRSLPRIKKWSRKRFLAWPAITLNVRSVRSSGLLQASTSTI